MDDGLKPANRPAKSLRAALDERSAETPTPDETNFQTPEEVAAADDLVEEIKLPEIDDHGSDNKDKSGGIFAKLKMKWPPERKEWMVSAAIIIVCGSIVGFVLTHTGTKPVAKASEPVKKATPKPTTEASNLTGLQVDFSVNKRPVTGIMIENSLDARPQSGLSEAGVVFEAIAEGGITRFLTLFQDTAPADIGPIRSARPYYVRWALGFDAGYAHVGGSPEALADIRALGVKDLDQFANAGSYHRVSSRAAPHNVYTGMANLNQLETAKGYGASQYTGFVRKKSVPSKTPNPTKIDLNISGALYNVHYDYNAASNSYNRSEGGAAHVDANGNKQISPSVVVALVIPHSYAGKYSVYPVVGSGAAFIFQDGTLTQGTWTKASDKDNLKFTDAAGKPLGLIPGQTWITAVGDAGRVTYTP